jgi:hypothetical protein
MNNYKEWFGFHVLSNGQAVNEYEEGEPIICYECDIPHVDNCPRCEGFGFHASVLPNGQAVLRSRDTHYS